MKLLSYSSRVQLKYFLLLFGIFSILFYWVIRWSVIQNVDEILHNRKENLISYLEKNPDISLLVFNPLDDYTFQEVLETNCEQGIEIFSDTLIYEFVDNELDEYRKLSTLVTIQKKVYKLEITEPHLEGPDIMLTIAVSLGLLLLGLALSFYLSNQIIYKRIWKPFYKTLDDLRHFRLDKQQMPELSNSTIDEFKLLNESIAELARKNMEVFESQKQFIEDVSHEMQTPLSVIQSRLEALISQEEITKEQAKIIEGIINSSQRLKKLNKTLLLLSKIENRQFFLTDKVNIAEIIDNSLGFFEELKNTLNIHVELKLQNANPVTGNILLTDVLIQNLLKNAFLHNVKNGSVVIVADKNKLSIANTGTENTIDQTKVFKRFYKNSENPDTWGLGLAITFKIAELSGWKLSYLQENNLHTLELTFQ